MPLEQKLLRQVEKFQHIFWIKEYFSFLFSKLPQNE